MLGGFNCGVTACRSGGRERSRGEGILSPPLARPSVAPRPLSGEVCSCCSSVRLLFRVRFHVAFRQFLSIGVLTSIHGRVRFHAKEFLHGYGITRTEGRVRASVGKLNLKVAAGHRLAW